MIGAVVERAATVRRLLADADIAVHGYRPGPAQRLRLRLRLRPPVVIDGVPVRWDRGARSGPTQIGRTGRSRFRR